MTGQAQYAGKDPDATIQLLLLLLLSYLQEFPTLKVMYIPSPH